MGFEDLAAVDVSGEVASLEVLELVFAMFEPFDALFDRRVSAKEVLNRAFFQRVRDEESFGGGVLTVHRLSMSVELLEGGNHTFGVTRDMSGAGVGEIFALTRDRELSKAGGDRRNKRDEKHND